MGMLAEGSLRVAVPDELTRVADVLIRDLTALAGVAPIVLASNGLSNSISCGTTPNAAAERGYGLVGHVLFEELQVRRLQAAQIRTLAAAVDGLEPARRQQRTGGSGSRGRAGSTSAFGGNDAAQDDDVTNDEEAVGGDGAEDPASSILPERLMAARLAPELNLHPLTAATEIGVAVGLVHDLPLIMALFDHGRLDKARASLICRTLHTEAQQRSDFGPDRPAWRLLEGLLAVQAPGLTFGEVKRLLQRLILGLDPDGGEAAHVRARRSRHVRVEAQPDGMALVTALVSAEVGQYLDGYLDIAADADRDRLAALGVVDGRTHEQRRADVLAALIQALAEGVNIPLAPHPGAESDGESEDSSRSSEPDKDVRNDRDPAEHTQNSQETKASRLAQNRCDKNADGAEAPFPEVPDSLHRRLEEELDAETSCRQEEFMRYGFAPLPQGTIPALWKVPDLPKATGRGVRLVITITDAAYLGLDNTPGLLEGHGAIPAALARRLGVSPAQVVLLVLPGAVAQQDSMRGQASNPAATATTAHSSKGTEARYWGGDQGRPQDKDPAKPAQQGANCSLGQDHTQAQTRRYRPGRTLVELVTTLYPHCTFPACTRRAGKCDLDHLIPFAKGGVSCLCNMHPSCRNHHRLKTFGGWNARPSRPGEPFPPGTIIWTTPDAADHASPPPCLPGAPGWSLPSPTGPLKAVPAPTSPPSTASTPEAGQVPEPEKLTSLDRMPSTERTLRRTRRWTADLAWHVNRQNQLRNRANTRKGRRDNANQTNGHRPATAPSGWGSGNLPELGDPSF